MRKIFILGLLPLFALTGCREEPATGLPDFRGDIQLLTPEKTSLTSNDSEAAEVVTLTIPDTEKSYQVEISTGCKLNTKGAKPQIQLAPGAYIKSVSTVTVDRLMVDFFGTKGTFFNVYSNAEGTGSTVRDYEAPKDLPVYDPDGGGKVLQYPINSEGWMIKNETEYNKPTFYAIYICLG